MYPLLNMVIFHCHVRLSGGILVTLDLRGCKCEVLLGVLWPWKELSLSAWFVKTALHFQKTVKTISIGGTSSNHSFSGDMLVFQGVTSPPLWNRRLHGMGSVWKKNSIPPKIYSMGLHNQAYHVPWFFLGPPWNLYMIPSPKHFLSPNWTLIFRTMIRLNESFGSICYACTGSHHKKDSRFMNTIKL